MTASDANARKPVRLFNVTSQSENSRSARGTGVNEALFFKQSQTTRKKLTVSVPCRIIWRGNWLQQHYSSTQANWGNHVSSFGVVILKNYVAILALRNNKLKLLLWENPIVFFVKAFYLHQCSVQTCMQRMSSPHREVLTNFCLIHRICWRTLRRVACLLSFDKVLETTRCSKGVKTFDMGKHYSIAIFWIN